MTSYKVGYLVGSLSKASINRLLATALVRLAPAELQMSEISFKDLPLYSYDYDANFPPAATEFKSAIAAVDAVLFVTPEYNRSIPGGLKNAIDWASRPYGTNAFARKPSGIIGTSPGKIGTAVAQQHLRSILAFCNSPLMNSVEAYIQFERGLITDDGRVTNAVHRAIPPAIHRGVRGVHRQGVHGTAAEPVAAVPVCRPDGLVGDEARGPWFLRQVLVRCRRAILPVDPLDGTAGEVGTHGFTESREKGFLAEALEKAETFELVLDWILHLGETQLDSSSRAACRRARR